MLHGVDASLRRIERNSYIIAGIAAGSFLAMSLWVALSLSPPPVEWQTIGLYAVLVMFTVASALVPRAVKRMVRVNRAFLKGLLPRTREARYERFFGPRVVFDNGLIFQITGPGEAGSNTLSFLAFMDERGTVVVPRLDDIVAWATTFRQFRDKAGRVTRQQGPTESRVVLLEIQSMLGAQGGNSLLYAHSPGAGNSGDVPRWMAGATFPDIKWYTKADRVLGAIDPILSFLKSLPTRDFSAK